MFDHGLNLSYVLHAQLLQLLGVSMLIIHDHKLGFSVDVHLQGVSNNHFSHEFGHLLDGHLEHLGESLKAERLVLAGGSEEESFKGGLLEVDCKHTSELFSLSLGHTLDEGDRADVVHSSLPVGLVKSAGSEDDIISVLLSSQMESTTIVEFNEALETAGDHGFVHGELVLGVVRDLEHHGADEVAAVEYLQVDLHVEGNLELLSLALLCLVVAGLILVSAVSLGKELLVLGVVADVSE